MELCDILHKLKGNTVNLIVLSRDSNYSYNDIKEILSENDTIVISDNRRNECVIEDEQTLNRKNVFKDVSATLKYIGMTPNIKGFTYIINAVCDIVETPEKITAITKQVYPDVAKKYKTTAACVERSIRHAIEKNFSLCDTREKISELVGYNVTFSKARPSNGEFIALVADYIETKNL